MNAYEIKEQVMSREIDNCNDVAQILVMMADKLIDLEHEVNRLRAQATPSTSAGGG